VDITKLQRDGDDIIQVGVPQGRTYVKYRRSPARDSVLQIDTPLVSVMAYGSAKFDLNVYEDGYAEVSVIDGVVYVEGQHGNTKVDRGSMISVGSDNYAELSPMRPKDDWVRWNIARDSAYAKARGSSRYLPPALGVYSHDFDEYGWWVHTPDYGYVWRPTLVVSGWAPYRTGRWVWARGDYVWVSYEPWGWAPYHYGRWAFRVGIGWFWVPPAVNAVFWSPGFVAWIYTPTYVSWVPLAPREIYYGYGYYGPHSVNLTKVNVKTINITNVYVNSRVTNAVTVVHTDTFLTGKRVKVSGAPANPFVAGPRISPGRPDIKPVKATVVPLPTKVIPERAMPSKRLVEKQKTLGISKRPVAVKENVSVFKAGKPASPMPVRKIEKPRPVTSVLKPGTGRPTERETKEKPQVMPKEGAGRPPVGEREKAKPEVRKAVPGRPAVTPKEGIRKPPVGERERAKPEVRKAVSGRPAVTPREGVSKPSKQEKGRSIPEGQKGMKERPQAVPKQSEGRPPQVKEKIQKQEKKVEPFEEKNSKDRF
jgi:hypothetical protein